VLVRALQLENSELSDIPYNFLIGGDGKVYEGRGFEYEGQHTESQDATEYNSIGIGIAFIGKYEITAPNENQMKVLNEFVEYFKLQGEIDDNNIFLMQDSLMYSNESTSALKTAISSLPNFYSCKLTENFLKHHS
jgi:hypothetical protein